MKRRSFAAGTLAITLCLSGCSEQAPLSATPGAAEAAERAVETVTAAERARADDAAEDSERKRALEPAFTAEEYAELIDRLSEPDGDFFSKNYISNETSYLQIAEELDEMVPAGGVYVGVGPEQNFSYMALTEPELAFVVDVRRDNMVLHLLYKAAFDLARDRAHFLALLTGREDDGRTLDPEASVEAIVKHVDGLAATERTAEATHTALRERVERGYGIALDGSDARSFDRAHRAFSEDGLDLQFELEKKSFRTYPKLRELITAETPEGEARGFLSSHDLFARVQRMQRENRIVPLVGNFGGDRTLPQLAELLEERSLTLRTFYVSNVEQYLLLDGLWWKWSRNVEAFPIDDDSMFIRCYLDQGRPHPRQMQGHRTTTVLQRIGGFNEREDPYRSMLAVSTDRIVAP